MERNITDDDLWGTDSGLFTDYEGTVIDAWFNVDTNIQNSPTFLFLKMGTDNESHAEWTERYNCGPDWQSVDGGETVVHPTKMKFNRQSQAGILVDKAVELVGDDIRSWGSPLTAKTWLGSRWYMEAVTRQGTRRDTQEKWTSTRNYPARFLGKGEAAGEESVGTVGRGVPEVGEHEGAVNVDAPILQMMKKLANDGLTHEQWMDKVLELPGALDNDELIRSLPKPGFYESMKGS